MKAQECFSNSKMKSRLQSGMITEDTSSPLLAKRLW